jgi:predicted GTPase
MPYGDLEAMRVQRFATQADIDAAHPTVEEREEYERPVELGMIMYAGVDYAAILEQAQEEADVIVWDGGNNDFSFFRPDITITVTDPLRPGHELRYHPGETNLRLADVVVLNKLDSAEAAAVKQVLADIRSVNPNVMVVHAESPLTLEDGPEIYKRRVLAIDDGPTITHGQMPFGAAVVAAKRGGAFLVDPRPYAVGSIADVFEKWPHIGAVLPAMGYSDEQLADLKATIDATPCDVVLTGTPTRLDRLITSTHPMRHITYELDEIGVPTLTDALAPVLEKAKAPVGARSPRTRHPFSSWSPTFGPASSSCCSGPRAT